MAFALDEFGRPFIMIKEQEKKTRLRFLDAENGICIRSGNEHKLKYK